MMIYSRPIVRYAEPTHKFRKKVFHTVRHPYFEITVLGAIVANTFTLCLQ